MKKLFLDMLNLRYLSVSGVGMSNSHWQRGLGWRQIARCQDIMLSARETIRVRKKNKQTDTVLDTNFKGQIKES